MINLIYERTTGKKLTLASWLREFVTKHKSYRHDSILTNEIALDLITAMNEISQNKKTYEDYVPLQTN